MAIADSTEYATITATRSATVAPEPLLQADMARLVLPFFRRPPIAIGSWAGSTVYAGFLDQTGRLALLEHGFAFAGIRQYFQRVDNSVPAVPFELFARATHLGNWFNETRFCAACGGALVDSSQDCAKVCSLCQTVVYPRINPAVIVAICRGDQLLLGRSARYRTSFYSLLAGYCEAGESLEQTVAREVREEVGIEITNIRYWDSQSWPFSQSLMLGFLADYASGELCPDNNEIIAAAWFDLANLPETPPAPSLAWYLINHLKQLKGL